MNYELAKQLKDAGFPKLDLVFVKDLKHFIPSLSELIDACGDKFHWLNKMKSQYDEDVWNAMALSKEFGRGKTPEEAVAKLWIKLNKK